MTRAAINARLDWWRARPDGGEPAPGHYPSCMCPVCAHLAADPCQCRWCRSRRTVDADAS